MTAKQKPAGDELPPDEQLPGDARDDFQAATADAATGDQGVLLNVMMTPADFLPDRNRAWPTHAVGSQPQGFKVVIGSISGVAHGSERRQNDYKGKTLESVWLHGSFIGTVRATGEIVEAVSLIAPQAYALKIERLLQTGGEGARVPVDFDLGLESTGRVPVTYRWFAMDYAESKERAEALQLAAKHKARLAGPQAPRLIEGK